MNVKYVVYKTVLVVEHVLPNDTNRDGTCDCWQIKEQGQKL